MKSIRHLLKCLLLLVALSNLAHAFYDPGQGRWLSRDPVGEEGGSHLYAFVENDGVNAIDPLGQTPCSEYKKVRVRNGISEGRTTADDPTKPKKQNGCGTPGLFSIVPDSYFWSVFFTPSCNKHDDCYQTCGKDHKVCDKELGDDMTNKCKEKYGKNNPNLYACMAQAAIYKNVLYGVGGIAFESAQDEHCIWKCCEKEKK